MLNRKSCMIIYFLVILLVLVGCGHMENSISPVIPDSTTSTGTDQYEEVKKIDGGKNYAVYEVYNDNAENTIYYIVEIFDDSGNNWFNAEFDFPEPNVAFANEGVIEIEKPTGTGFSEIQYFDIQNRVVSKKYNITEPSLFVDGKLIQQGSGNGTRVTVTTVFDETEDIKDILIDSDPYTIETLSLIDEQIIEVVYLRYNENNKLEKKTAVITVDQLK